MGEQTAINMTAWTSNKAPEEARWRVAPATAPLMRARLAM
jgi:hypothetical protein